MTKYKHIDERKLEFELRQQDLHNLVERILELEEEKADRDDKLKKVRNIYYKLLELSSDLGHITRNYEK